MKEILKEYNSIVETEKSKNIYIIGLLLLCGVMTISYAFFIFNSKVVILSADGAQQKFTTISVAQAQEINAKNQVLYFVYNFYDFDKWNLEAHINNALWISDNTVKELYINFKKNDWYNEIIRQNIRQEVVVDNKEIEIDFSKEPFHCVIPLVLHLRQEGVDETYKFTTQFYLKAVSQSFATNRHGFEVCNITQSQFTKTTY